MRKGFILLCMNFFTNLGAFPLRLYVFAAKLY
jgi:hypothetical protein